MKQMLKFNKNHKRSVIGDLLLITTLSFMPIVDVLADSDINYKDKMFDLLGFELLKSQCSIVMQKQFHVTDKFYTVSSYIADNTKLHQCQYIYEMAVSQKDLTEKNYPTYEEWSKSNPEFSPSMPRSSFVAELEKRRSAVDKSAPKGD